MNTIYDGTYVIGQTSATNFVAGPGIKIDEPSAGTVRIGNDETVLWSGVGTHTDTITLSESVFNFRYIKIDAEDIYGWGSDSRLFPVNSAATVQIHFNPEYVFETEGAYYHRFSNIIINPNTPTSMEVKSCELVRQSNGNITFNNNSSNVLIKKVIGINRKEV